MLERLPRPGPRAAAATAVLLACATVLGAVAAVLVLGREPSAADLRRASVLAGAAAVAAFGLAVLLVARTRRLRPALWGYVPGLVCAIASGLAVGAV